MQSGMLSSRSQSGWTAVYLLVNESRRHRNGGDGGDGDGGGLILTGKER